MPGQSCSCRETSRIRGVCGLPELVTAARQRGDLSPSHTRRTAWHVPPGHLVSVSGVPRTTYGTLSPPIIHLNHDLLVRQVIGKQQEPFVDGVDRNMYRVKSANRRRHRKELSKTARFSIEICTKVIAANFGYCRASLGWLQGQRSVAWPNGSRVLSIRFPANQSRARP
jgi:hypothetical protein